MRSERGLVQILTLLSLTALAVMIPIVNKAFVDTRGNVAGVSTEKKEVTEVKQEEKAAPTLMCKEMWMFDEKVKAGGKCKLKEFCGAYMYDGLKTFAEEKKCGEELLKSFKVIPTIKPLPSVMDNKNCGGKYQKCCDGKCSTGFSVTKYSDSCFCTPKTIGTGNVEVGESR